MNPAQPPLEQTEGKIMNVKLLRKIKKHILEEPRRFAMSWWIGRGKPGEKLAENSMFEEKQTFASCGTAACLAGWACILGGEKNIDNKNEDVAGRAEELLDLTGDQGDMFGIYDWPEKYSLAYRSAATPRGRARAAARFIDFLIKNPTWKSYGEENYYQ